MRSSFTLAIILAYLCEFAAAQQPVVTTGGIVSAASYTQPVAPGSIAAIFGANLGDAVYRADGTPLPMSLGGTSVTVKGIPAPMFYVSPTQINIEIPSNIPVFANGPYTQANVIVTTKSGSSAPEPASVFVAGPGVFTPDQSGCGRAAALNVAPDGSLSANTATKSAAPGDVVAIYGTGFGVPLSPPADGSPSFTAGNLKNRGGFLIDGSTSASALYYGVAPSLVGMDQANFQIPIGTRDGCAVPIAVGNQGTISPTVYISVHSTRGQCVDPPPQSYGSIMFLKTTSTGTGADGESDTFTAQFPSGPNVVRRAAEAQNGYFGGLPLVVVPGRTCPVPGYVDLPAGPISVSGPSGSIIATSNSQSGTYSQNLPAGFIGGGTYAISAVGGSIVGPLQATFAIDPPIQAISVTRNSDVTYPALKVTWTGSAPSSVVKITLLGLPSTQGNGAYAYTAAGDGSFTFPPMCAGRPVSAGGSGELCTLPLSGPLQEVLVEQIPLTSQIPTFQASGITGDIQVSWLYRSIIGPSAWVSAPIARE